MPSQIWEAFKRWFDDHIFDNQYCDPNSYTAGDIRDAFVAGYYAGSQNENPVEE